MPSLLGSFPEGLFFMPTEPDPNQVTRLPVDQLAQLCAQETQKFRRNHPYTPQYCFELMRRALVGHNQYAWSKVYEQYQPFVRGWVLSHRAAGMLSEDLD